MDVVFEALLQIGGFYTAKVLLPLVSFGYLNVLPKGKEHRKSWWGEHPFERRPQGGFSVEPEMAIFIGAMFWLVVLMGLALYFWS